MNTTKTTMIASLVVLLLAMSSTASATYYYTGEYFDKTFGDAKITKTSAELKHNVMMYTDSDVFHNEFGISPLKDGLLARPLVGKPDESPAAEETALELPANETPGDGAIETVLLANGTEITLDNETEVVTVSIMIDVLNGTMILGNATAAGAAEANATEANATEANATEANAIEAILPTTPTEPVAEEPIIIVTEAEAGSLVVDEKSGGAPAGEGIVAEDSGRETEDSTLAPTPAVVSGEGTPMQIGVIAVLIIVIVAMLAVLLMREDKGEKGSGKKNGKNGKNGKKDDWEEGSFFKEAKEKKAVKESKAVEIRAADQNNGASQRKEIKPFLLKIKEEA